MGDKKAKYVQNILHVVQHHLNVKIRVKVKNGEKLLNIMKKTQTISLRHPLKEHQNKYSLINLLKEVITEVSIADLEAQFVDAGKISSEDFKEIIDATGNKSAYATWLAKKVADKIIKPEDIYKYKKYFLIFDRNKKLYPFPDINQYKRQVAHHLEQTKHSAIRSIRLV